MRTTLAHGALIAGLLLCSVAYGQSSGPTWNELSPAQREALAPLAKDWPGLDADRKRKWLEVATRYPNLTPEGKQKLHERMAKFARLTPEQKKTARENFRRAYEVPAEQREATVQKYRDLPPDKKRELAEKASKNADATRRSPKEHDVKPARPPSKTEPTSQ
jgi:hypothetical protein